MKSFRHYLECFWVLTVAISGIVCFEKPLMCELCVWVERRAGPSPLQPPSDEGIEGTQWRKMSTFRNFFTFFNGIHPQMKHLKLKNLCDSSENKPPSSAAKYIAVSDTCGQVVHDEARAILNQKITKKLTWWVNFMASIESWRLQHDFRLPCQYPGKEF